MDEPLVASLARAAAKQIARSHLAEIILWCKYELSYGASAPAASPPFTGSNMTQGGWKMGPRGYKVTLGRWKMASGGGNMAQGGWKMGPRGCKVTLGSWTIGSGGGRMAQEGWKRGWDGWEISFGGWNMAVGDGKMVIGNCKMDLLAGNIHFS